MQSYLEIATEMGSASLWHALVIHLAHASPGMKDLKWDPERKHLAAQDFYLPCKGKVSKEISFT